MMKNERREQMIKNDKRMLRRPSHPGEILREEFMPDYGLTVARMARDLGVSRQSVSDLVHEHKALTADMAVRLSLYFGNSAEQWLGYQKTLDVWRAQKRMETDASRPQPIALANCA
jgi:addiction module HigA family antidote